MTSIGDSSGVDELGGMEQEQRPEGESMDRADTIENVEGGESTDALELEEATLDPAALIEAQQEYGQAEAVEAAMTELVDAATANAPPTEEVTAEPVIHDGDPLGEMKESGEKGGTEDVVGVEGHMRTGYDRESGSQGNVEIHGQGQGEPVPTEEIGGVGGLEGVIAQAQEGADDGKHKGNVETELTSDIDGESKDDQHGDEITDHKPIPAEEAILNLDGKGPDITKDPMLKGELEEGVIPEVSVEEGIVLGGIDTLESGSDLVDFKFFKVEGQSGQEGSLIAKDPAYLEALQPSQSMEAALGRAVIDPAFRQELLDDAQGALSEFELSDEEVALLGQIDPEGLQQVANQIKSQFENLDDPAAQTVLGRIISNVLSSGSGVLKGE